MKNAFFNKKENILSPHYRLQVLLASVLTVVQSFAQVAVAVLMRYIIDSALSADGKLLLWGGALCADIALMIVLHIWISWQRAAVADRFTASLRQEILSAAVFTPDPTLRSQHSGVLLSRGMEDVHTLCDGTIYAIPALVGQIARLGAAFAAVIILYPPLAWVLMAAVAILGGIAACLRPVLRKHHRLVRETDEKVMSTMQEDFRQLELIQGLGIQKQIEAGFARKTKANLQAKKSRRAWSVGSNSLIFTMSQLGTGLVLLWGASQISTQALTYGTLMAVLQLLSMFRTPALGISALWTRFAAVEVATERLSGLLTPAREISTAPKDLEISQIVFEDVTFCYPEETEAVVENFSATFTPTPWASLGGISGKGKSTLFKLMLGLYAPEKGRIYLKTNRGEIPCSEAVRSLFAYVPQDYALFTGTVEENLRLIKPDATEAEMVQALGLAGAEFLMETENKLQTQVGEGNTGLSMGQLQRIAIARAILADRPVFLLDECTSALDAQTEKKVLTNLRQMNKQAILVTHRPEALNDLAGITTVLLNE